MNYLYITLMLQSLSSLILFKTKFKELGYLILLSFALLLCFVSLYRFNVGNDFISYNIYYTAYDQIGGVKEPLFEWLIQFFRLLKLEFRHFLLFFMAMTVYNFFSLKKGKFAHILMFSLSGYLFFALDQIRQAASLSFLFPLIFQSDNWSFRRKSVYAAMAVGLHYSAIVYVISLGMRRFLSMKPRSGLFCGVLLLTFAVRSDVTAANYIKNLAGIAFFEDLFNLMAFVEVNNSFGVTLLLSNITCMFLCCMATNNRIDLNTIINFSFCWNVLFIFCYDNFILNRLGVIGFYLPLFSIVHIVHNCPVFVNKLFFGVVCVIWLLYFLVTVNYELGKHGAFPLVIQL